MLYVIISLNMIISSNQEYIYNNPIVLNVDNTKPENNVSVSNLKIEIVLKCFKKTSSGVLKLFNPLH